IKTKVAKLKVTEADIDSYLDELLSKNALLMPLGKKDKTKLGDVVTLKYKGFVNNEPFEGGEADQFDLKLGSKTFIDTFEDQLVGKSVG
ncbi:trigger factor, partial [Xanthomonas citri pv. citri]|nr:trigger factor [Xanthomonas citri pv. citri]